MTTSHTIKALTPETFPAWLALAQKHNGVWGGCYCSYFHGDTEHTVKNEYDRATFKRRLVAEGVAHAALVFDGDDAIAWCEYGSPVELPNIYHRKQYDAGETRPAPWRITCFFVDRDHRRSGVAREALDGALDLIAASRRRRGRLLPQRAHPGQEDVVLVPAQRHSSHVRESRVHLRASHRQEQDRDAQDGDRARRVRRGGDTFTIPRHRCRQG